AISQATEMRVHADVAQRLPKVVRNGVSDLLELSVRALERHAGAFGGLLARTALGDIAEYQSVSVYFAAPVANWRRAIVDRDFAPVPRNEQSVIRETHHRAGPQNPGYGIFARLPGFFVYDYEY